MKRNCMFIRVNKKYVALKFDQLIYAASQRNDVVLYCTDKTIVTKMRLSDLEVMLPKEGFCRIHRSYIVRIEEILWFDSENVAISKFTLPIGELYRHQLLHKLLTSDH